MSTCISFGYPISLLGKTSPSIFHVVLMGLSKFCPPHTYLQEGTGSPVGWNIVLQVQGPVIGPGRSKWPKLNQSLLLQGLVYGLQDSRIYGLWDSGKEGSPFGSEDKHIGLAARSHPSRHLECYLTLKPIPWGKQPKATELNKSVKSPALLETRPLDLPGILKISPFLLKLG